MLSLGKMKNPKYYFAFTSYYLEGGEPDGKWFGKGAERLGLVGRVRKRHFRNLFRGLSPRGDALVQNVGRKKRNAGIDLTFSAPKGVSVIWAIAPKWIRQDIQGCHDRAVRRTLQFLEDELLYLRRGKNGTEQRQCELVAALFQHSSSRLADPDLHTHALVLNAGHADGRWNAIDARHIYKWKMAMGAIYRTQLVHELCRTLGISFERIKTWVEVKGLVPERLLRYFSKRSQELRNAMRLYGADSAKASDIASLRTRKAKRVIPRPELFRQWRREAKAQGFGREEVGALLESGAIGQPGDGFETLTGLMPLLTNAVHACIEEISEFRSHFPRRLLIETFMPRATEFKVSADLALRTIDNVLSFDPGIVELEVLKGEQRFATRKTLAQETALKEHVSTLKERPGFVVPNDVVRKVMLSREHLALEQLNGLSYILDGQGCIKALVGVPGSGKTELIAAAREAFADVGIKMIGCSNTGRAARNLERKSGISSSTIRRLQLDLERTSEAAPPPPPESIYGLPTYSPDKVSLDEQTLLVIDEAGMNSTADALDLLTKAVDAGAMVLLVGDENQLPPIGAGAPFEAITRDIVHASLAQIRRFENQADKDALRLIAEGKPEPALKLYADRGLLVVEDSPHAVREKVVADYVHNGGIDYPQDHIILVGTNAQRQYYNEQIQKLRQEAGMVSSEGIVVRGELLAAGDRVMFLRNDRRLDVRNGDIGTVIATDQDVKQRLHVTLDSGRSVKVALENYDDLTRAYAATVHKFQGADVANTYAVIGGPMQSRELTYTQLSRHQIRCCLYTDKIEAGEKLERLHRQILAQSRECLASELLIRTEGQVPPPDGERALETKTRAHDPFAAGNARQDFANLTIPRQDERLVSAGEKQQLSFEQSPQRAGWVSLKRSDAHTSSTPSLENPNREIEQHLASAGQRTYVRISPPIPQFENPETSAPPQSYLPQAVVALDDSNKQAQSVEKPSIPAAPGDQHRHEKLPPAEQLAPLPHDTTRSKWVDGPASNGAKKQTANPTLPEGDTSPAPHGSESRYPPPEQQTVDRLGTRPPSDNSVILPQRSHTDWVTAPSPSLALVGLPDRSTSGSADSSESRSTNATNAAKRTSETLSEQELRIAREARAQRFHEDHISPQIDSTSSGPKPA